MRLDLRAFICVFCTVCLLTVEAQQMPQFTQFQYTSMLYNPAATGMADALNISTLYRNQWTGLAGNPTTFYIGADMPLYNLPGGLGISMYSDQLGVESNLGVKLNFAYHKKLGTGIMSLGVNAGLLQKSLDGSLLRSPEGIYENGNNNHNDLLLPNQKISALTPDGGLGIYYQGAQWYSGIGLNHLWQPKVSYDFNNTIAELQYIRHYFVEGGLKVDLSEDLQLQPSLLVKTDLDVVQTDVSAILTINNNIWAGLAFRGYHGNSVDALAGMAGVKFARNFKGGYSYDFGISKLNSVHGGSHELFINYQLPLEKPGGGKIINNPRFLSY